MIKGTRMKFKHFSEKGQPCLTYARLNETHLVENGRKFYKNGFNKT
jgi:hypothetical protein